MSTTPFLDLGLPADHSQDWGIPTINGNFTLIDTFAETCIIDDPTASQTITQPASTYLNINSLQAFGATPVIRFGVAVNVWDSAISRTAAGAFSFDTNTVGNSAASAKASVFNATAGFQVNSAAPSGFILVGNGTNFVASNTLPAGLGFYQTIQQAGTPVTQRRITNYLAPLTAVDDAGNGSTDVGLAASGVTAGSYTAPTLTIAANGLITAAVNNALTSVTNSNGTYIVFPDGTYLMWGSVTLGSTGNAHSVISATFPHAFVGTPTVQVTMVGYPDNSNTSELGIVTAAAVTSTGMTVNGMCPAVSGGGGANFNNSVVVNWFASGK